MGTCPCLPALTSSTPPLRVHHHTAGSLPLPRGAGGRILRRLVHNPHGSSGHLGSSSASGLPSLPFPQPPPPQGPGSSLHANGGSASKSPRSTSGHGAAVLAPPTSTSPPLPPVASAHPSAGAASLGLGGLGSASSACLLLNDALADELFSLLDQLQQHFSILMLANLQRTAWLCSSVAAPAMWALEVSPGQGSTAPGESTLLLSPAPLVRPRRVAHHCDSAPRLIT